MNINSNPIFVEDSVKIIQCPNCGYAYEITESNIQKSMVPCWQPNCGASYLQAAHVITNFSFCRAAIHALKGH